MTNQNFATREAARWRALAYDAADHAAELEALAAAHAVRASRPAPPPASGTRPMLALVVGHQKTAPGAMAVEPIRAPEYEWCGGLAMLVADAARAGGLAVRVFWRDDGGIRGAYGRVRDWIAEGTAQGMPACAIELHFNAFNGLVSGTETLVVTDAPRERDFALAIQRAMVEALGLPDRGVKPPHPKRGAVALNQLDVPHVLIEPMFGDNLHDAGIAHARQHRLADALAGACVAFLTGD